MAALTSEMFSQRTFGRTRPARSMGGRNRLGLVAAAATLLATAPLSAIFHGWGWLFQCLVAVAAVAGAAAGARMLRAPLWGQLLAMLGALLLALTWIFPSGEELLGVLPTPATLEHFGVVLNDLPGDVRTNAVPAPALPSLVLVTVLGVGLVAIVVDLCAVGLRRPALAGLPMLAIYSVPVAVMFRSVPAITFAIGVAGYLWLLGTDSLDRVRRFGRRFTGDGRDVDVWEPSPLAAAGRRLAVVGMLVAMLIPVAVPGITTGLVDRFGSGFAGLGSGGSSTEVNLFASLDGLLNRDEILEMLEVSTDDPDPHYLRFGVADQITAEGFDHRRPRGERAADITSLPPSRPGVTYQHQQAEVRVLNSFSMPRLPVYPELQGINGTAGSWRFDTDQQVVFSGEESTGEEYFFEYARPEYDPDALREAVPLPPGHEMQRFAELPNSLREPQVTNLVAELTGGLDNAYDQVLAILGHFSTANDFRYSLETGNATTGSAIVDFLIVNKRGYCVQFAAAMAWMVRELGLPSRVAIGFTSGRSRTEGTYTLTNHNAHAWPEVYFEGFGWVPFEPTPSSSIPGSVTPRWAPDPNAPEAPDPTDPDAGDNVPGPGATAPPEEGPEFGDAGGTVDTPAGNDGVSRVWWWVLGGAMLLLALLAAPALSRAWLRRSRLPRGGVPGRLPEPAADPAPGVVTVTGAATDPVARRWAHGAWDELLDTMVDFGVPLDPAETPRVTAARLVKQCRLDRGADAAGDDARLLGQAEERARYARTPLPPAGVPGALRTVRQALAGRSTRATRLRAALLPPSTVQRWRQAVSDVATSTASIMSKWSDVLARLSPRRLLRSS